MDCPNCGNETLSFRVPAAVADLLPDDRPGAAFCPRCLTVTPVDDPPADLPDFHGALAALPEDPAAAATVACLLAVLDSLALYRSEADAIAARAERSGVDVLLVLDRLRRDPDVDPHFDLERRSTQLQQLI